jgi:hypothetical protein
MRGEVLALVMITTLLHALLLSATLPLAGGSDSCATPLAIFGQGRFDFDLTLATTGTEGQTEAICLSNGTSGIASDVWYEWMATTDGIARLYTCGQTLIDTKVAIYSGSGCPTNGSALACNEDFCGWQSSLEWSVTAGSVYTIQLGLLPGAGTGSGSFELFVGPLAADNVALAGVATQSTNYSATAGLPGNAIDGNTDGTWLNGSCTHTDPTSPSNWWEVDLGGSHPIGPILLYNRTDCCHTRLSNFRVSIFQGATEVWGEDAHVGTGYVMWNGVHRVVPPLGISGDRVRVGFLGMNNDGNANLTLAEVQVTLGFAGTVYCTGDGSGTSCPCANWGGQGTGCANSTGFGGVLSSGGAPSVLSSTLSLQASQLAPGGLGIFFQGKNTINSGMGRMFGDGLRCAGGAAVRLQVVMADASGDSSTNVNIGAVSGAVAGDTRRYQFWYLDALSPCGSGFNLTNAVEVVWGS